MVRFLAVSVSTGILFAFRDMILIVNPIARGLLLPCAPIAPDPVSVPLCLTSSRSTSRRLTRSTLRQVHRLRSWTARLECMCH